RFRQTLEEFRREQPLAQWTELPVAYARQLVQEALELNVASGTPEPRELAPYRRFVASPERPFERALVYEQISPMEARLSPQLVDESARLLALPELESWRLPRAAMQPYVERLTRARSGRLLLP